MVRKDNNLFVRKIYLTLKRLKGVFALQMYEPNERKGKKRKVQGFNVQLKI